MDTTSNKLITAAAGASGGGPYSLGDPKLESHGSALQYSWYPDRIPNGTTNIYNINKIEKPLGMYLDSSGTRLYIFNGNSSNRNILSYTLSTPYDLSTATFVSLTGSQNIAGVFGSNFVPSYLCNLSWNTNGTKCYLFSRHHSNSVGHKITEMDASTPWDATTLTFNQDIEKTGTNSANVGAAKGAWIDPNGYRYAISTYNPGASNTNRYYIELYQTSTAFDWANATNTFNFNLDGYLPSYGRGYYEFHQTSSITFNSTGTKMYLHSSYTGSTDFPVYYWNLSTPWNTNTASFGGEQGGTMYQTTPKMGMLYRGSKSLIWSTNGQNLYQLGPGLVRRYYTPNPWDITQAAQVDSDRGVLDWTYDGANGYGHGQSRPCLSPSGTYMTYKTSGYTTGGGYTRAHFTKIPLTTAFDISTADYANAQNCDVLTKAGNIRSFGTSYGYENIFFNNDGTKVYVSYNYATGNDGTVQFALSTPYDLNSTWTQEHDLQYDNFTYTPRYWNDPVLVFSNDGTKAWVMGCPYNAAADPTFRRYDLSTAWDLSTATQVQEAHAGSAVLNNLTGNPGYYNPTGFFHHAWNDDGTKLFFNGVNSSYTRHMLYEVNCSTPYDFTSMTSYENIFENMEIGQIGSIYFNADGRQLIVFSEHQNAQYAGGAQCVVYDL